MVWIQVEGFAIAVGSQGVSSRVANETQQVPRRGGAGIGAKMSLANGGRFFKSSFVCQPARVGEIGQRLRWAGIVRRWAVA